MDDPIALIVHSTSHIAQTYYYHTDGLGSTVSLTDSAGAVVETYKYGAYGEPEIHDGPTGALLEESAVGNNHLYTGQIYDAETGFYYYKARYYSPTLGRFLQRDPLGYVDGYNLYAYVNNNPLNFIDPLGMNSKENSGNASAGNSQKQWWDIDFDDVHAFLDSKLEEGPGFTESLYGLAKIFTPTQSEFNEDMAVSAMTFGVGGMVKYGGRTATKIEGELLGETEGILGAGKRLVGKISNMFYKESKQRGQDLTPLFDPFVPLC